VSANVIEIQFHLQQKGRQGGADRHAVANAYMNRSGSRKIEANRIRNNLAAKTDTGVGQAGISIAERARHAFQIFAKTILSPQVGKLMDEQPGDKK